MNLIEKIAWYRRNKGLRALVGRVLNGRETPLQHTLGQESRSAGMTPSAADLRALAGQVVEVDTLIRQSFAPIQPLPIYRAPGPHARINLVTDSVSPGSLFGGVATAIILAALMAKRTGAKLRVITRSEAPEEAGFAHVLRCNGIEFDGNVEFVQMALWDKNAQLDISDGDRFLTTSWWTTASVLGSVPASKVDYLLQEDERMFYPHGDDWLRCHEVLSREDIRFVVNTELLFRHFIDSGFEHMNRTATWFEPAFPAQLFKTQQTRESGEKLKFFFYARPNNLRNLFYRGIEALDRAVAECVLDPEKWDVYFVGKDIPKLKLGGVMEPIILPTMEWKEYGAFVASIDLGFCLMATPHPSYPPLDLAVAGALVLTNQFGLKQDLHNYSARITCVAPNVRSLLDGLRETVARAEAERRTGVREGLDHCLSGSWTESLVNVVARLEQTACS